MSFKLHYIHILEKLFHHNLTLMHVELNWIYFFQATCVYLKRRNQTKKRSKRSGWKVPWNKKRGFSLQVQWNKIDVVGRRTFQVSAENERENVRKSNRIVLWWEVKFQTFVCICVWEYVILFSTKFHQKMNAKMSNMLERCYPPSFMIWAWCQMSIKLDSMTKDII